MEICNNYKINGKNLKSYNKKTRQKIKSAFAKLKKLPKWKKALKNCNITAKEARMLDADKDVMICNDDLKFLNRRLGKKPKPCLPITQLSKILTLFLIKQFLITVLDPIEQLFPIITFFSIMVL